MLKVFLIVFGLLQSSTCNHSSAPAIPVNSQVNVKVNAPLPKPTPPVEQTLSECTQNRAKGLSAEVNIPQELCFDVAKPVDAKEKSDAKVGNSPQSATIEETDLSFEKLPAEVQKIVQVTVPDIKTADVIFDLTIIPTPDERAKNRLVNSYSYSSSSRNKSAGKDPNRHTWLFKRQNNLLKLDYAEINLSK